jgi:nitrate/TMAO reductase-like tetraheme cytochrome c subunit/mono/diheme cytochrome c family protein
MKRLASWLKVFFFPPEDASRSRRVLPYAVLGILTFVLLLLGVYAWDYTNSPQFCGTVCHTMPPEYTAYLTSPHARVDCVECHIGRGFIATRISRKAGDIKHIVSLAFKRYEFPIQADELRPARETCERCHFPEKFSDDSLREIKHFANDIDNTPTSIFLTLKTGGGVKRLGLGRGIHWHIENQILYLALDALEQEIPYVRVVNEDGTVNEFVALDSGIDPETVDPADLKEMDCITCHNRISHLIPSPEITVDQLMSHGVISASIPEIRRKAIEALSVPYETNELAVIGISGLRNYYQDYYPDFYQTDGDTVENAILALQDAYVKSIFPEQKVGWNTHVNNVGHQDSPGCFRCHDGKHFDTQQQAIRLECNLCHAIPVVAGPADFVANIEISRGPEPQSHLNTNWIGLHRDVFDTTCANCHSTEDPGGVSNTSFCSNSACHGIAYEYASFDAPGLREILREQIPTPTTPETATGALTYDGEIGQIFRVNCGGCHSSNGIQELDLTTYQSVLEGGLSGPAIVPGEPDASLVLQKLTGEQPHFSQLTQEELDLLRDWINTGAPEN